MAGSSSPQDDTADLLVEAGQLVELGLERYGRNQTEQAIKCWERALELDPSNDRALDYLSAAGWTGRRPTTEQLVERVCRRVDELIARGDDEAAWAQIEAGRPNPAKTAALAGRRERVQRRLMRGYIALIGDLDGPIHYDGRDPHEVPSGDERRLAMSVGERSSVREVLVGCGLEPFRAMRALAHLVRSGVVALENHAPPSTEVEQEKGTHLSNVNESLREAMRLDGAIAVALVDYESGMTLGTDGDAQSFNIEVAAAGNTQVVRSKLAVMRQLDIGGGIEDILITLDQQYHLIRLLKGTSFFLYVALDRNRGNLGMARHRLKAIESALVV